MYCLPSQVVALATTAVLGMVGVGMVGSGMVGFGLAGTKFAKFRLAFLVVGLHLACSYLMASLRR